MPSCQLNMSARAMFLRPSSSLAMDLFVDSAIRNIPENKLGEQLSLVRILNCLMFRSRFVFYSKLFRTRSCNRGNMFLRAEKPGSDFSALDSEREGSRGIVKLLEYVRCVEVAGTNGRISVINTPESSCSCAPFSTSSYGM
jgi:hypothetical protein